MLNPGLQDQDIQITHRRTGLILRVECKNAVRGSMRKGTKSCNVPHFNIKCHRSRSNIRLAGTTNDRYSVDSFDVIICNVSNALYQGKTFGAELELLHDKDVLRVVSEYYGVTTEKEIIEHAYSDWRFVFPQDIAEGGFIPRTPLVLLKSDPNWKPIGILSEALVNLIKGRRGR